jgi:hypothetical protein
MYDFISDVCNSYHNNPYHNFRHAVDVMQSIWYFLCCIHVLDFPTQQASTIRSEILLRPIDVLALMMAGLGHDLGHPGVNNGFMVCLLSFCLCLHENLVITQKLIVGHYSYTFSCVIQ